MPAKSCVKHYISSSQPCSNQGVLQFSHKTVPKYRFCIVSRISAAKQWKKEKNKICVFSVEFQPIITLNSLLGGKRVAYDFLVLYIKVKFVALSNSDLMLFFSLIQVASTANYLVLPAHS